MKFELISRKERIEAELRAIEYGLKDLNLENWEKTAFLKEAGELKVDLDHVNQHLALA